MRIKEEWCNDSSLYFQKEDASRIFTLHQEIASNVIESDESKILDFGSGDGKLFDSFPTINNHEITLYDIDETALMSAKKKLGAYPKVNFEKDIDKLPAGYFEAIILCNVIMLFKTEKEFRRVTKVIKRVKHKTGSIYVGLTHPCFLDKKFATYSNDYTIKKKVFNYFDNGTSYQVYMEKESNIIVIKDFFWNLSFIINIFLTTGFNLVEIKEFPDIEESNYSPFLLLKFN